MGQSIVNAITLNILRRRLKTKAAAMLALGKLAGTKILPVFIPVLSVQPQASLANSFRWSRPH